MERLINFTEDLKIAIRSSVKKCCCFNFDDINFGRLDQAKYILMETFDGKHIMLDGPDGNKIDCMFFPCTQKEEIICLKEKSKSLLYNDNELPVKAPLYL
jgi:hypothetical protein